MPTEPELCEDCQCELTDKTKNTGDRVLCDRCCENYTECDDCSGMFLTEDMQLDGDRLICEACCENYTQCDWCRNFVLIDTMTEVTSNQLVCESCAVNTGECSDCGERFHDDDLRYHEDRGHHYCNSCFPEDELIYDYHGGPGTEFFGTGERFYGGEFEIFTANRGRAAEIVRDTLGDHAYCTLDGSVDLEIVTQPHSYRAFESLIPRLLDTFDRLRRAGCRAYNDPDGAGRCAGVHIHISLKGVGPLTLARLGEFIYRPEHRGFIRAWSRRSEDAIRNYCALDWPDLRNIPRVVVDRKGLGRLSGLQSGRYWALNFNAKINTVEFRLFRGTTRGESIAGYYQSVQCLLEILQERPKLSPGEYIRAIRENRKRFPFAYKLLTENQRAVESAGKDC